MELLYDLIYLNKLFQFLSTKFGSNKLTFHPGKIHNPETKKFSIT